MATEKQKRVAKILAEKGGRPSVSAAMREAGYSEVTAATPKKLTGSKFWKELMDKYLPEDLLAEKHQELLNASGIDHMVFPLSMSDEDITALLKQANCIVKKFQHSETQTHVWFFASDNKARKEALDMAYKLRGRYAATKIQVSEVDELESLSDEDLMKKRRELQEAILKRKK